MSSSTGANLDAAAAKNEAKKTADSTNLAKMKRFVESTTLDDVVYDENKKQQVGRDVAKTTILKSIKGVTVKDLTVATLKAFCSKHKITGYKNKDKQGLCEIIARNSMSRGLQAAMYPDDFGVDGGGDVTPSDLVEDGGTAKKGGMKKNKKKNKSTKPSCIKSEGTYCRFLLTLFS